MAKGDWFQPAGDPYRYRFVDANTIESEHIETGKKSKFTTEWLAQVAPEWSKKWMAQQPVQEALRQVVYGDEPAEQAPQAVPVSFAPVPESQSAPQARQQETTFVPTQVGTRPVAPADNTAVALPAVLPTYVGTRSMVPADRTAVAIPAILPTEMGTIPSGEWGAGLTEQDILQFAIRNNISFEEALSWLQSQF